MTRCKSIICSFHLAGIRSFLLMSHTRRFEQSLRFTQGVLRRYSVVLCTMSALVFRCNWVRLVAMLRGKMKKNTSAPKLPRAAPAI